MVHHNGACQASGGSIQVVLPENLEFVEAEAPKGFIDQDGQRVTFRVGIIANATVTPLRLKVRAVQPGQTNSVFRVRVNGRNLRDPEVSFDLLVDGVAPDPALEPAPEPPIIVAPIPVEPALAPILSIRLDGSAVEINLITSPNRTVILE